MDMLNKEEEHYQAVYAACLEAAKSMGDDLTTMSWFGKNVRKNPNPLKGLYLPENYQKQG